MTSIRSSSARGMVSVVVRDTKQRIVCHRNNEAEASSPFIFEDRQNVLFNGADSVRNGKFSFTFAVPMDINYSEGTGLMNLYALKNDYSRSVNGAFERFQVNGSAATALIVEAILTALFVLVVLGATHKTNGATGNFAGLAIGLSLILIHLVGIHFTGTSVNPARSIGPALFAGGEALTNVWIFIAGPFIGSFIAAGLWKLVENKE